MKPLFIALLSLLIVTPSVAQDDLLGMLEEEAAESDNSRVFATFKTMRAVNLHTIEMVKKKTLDFRVTHRFGNIGGASGGGVHTLYGFDNIEDMRFSFDYGITEDLQIGVGRSKFNELLDGTVKYRILAQTNSGKMPITLVALAGAAITPKVDVLDQFAKTAHRVNYFQQIIIARKFGERLSFELLPTHFYQNLAVKDAAGTDENSIFAVGFVGRVKLTQRVAIIADYMYIASDYRRNHPDNLYQDPLGVGVEIETGGHVFHLTLTNASGIIENNYIPLTRDNWADGGFKLGFNISRVFNVGFGGGKE